MHLITNINYRQKTTPLCQQIHKTLLVLIQIFKIFISEVITAELIFEKLIT